MNSYEYLQEEAREDGVNVIDYPFDSNRIRGLYCDGTVAIRQDMSHGRKVLCSRGRAWSPPHDSRQYFRSE